VPADKRSRCDADQIWVITERRCVSGLRPTTTVLYPHQYWTEAPTPWPT